MASAVEPQVIWPLALSRPANTLHRKLRTPKPNHDLELHGFVDHVSCAETLMCDIFNHVWCAVMALSYDF